MTFAGGFRLAIGLLLTAGTLGVLFTALDPIWNGHPAYPATLLVGTAVGLVLIASAFWSQGRPDDLPTGQEVTPARPPRWRRVLRITGRVVGAVLVVVVLAILVWLRPFPAGAGARSALTANASVTVVDRPTSIELVPAGTPDTALVFVPGARVDARAYAQILRQVAEAGHLVVILKAPFGMAIAQPGQAGGVIEDHPEIGTWAVGGHSLGGVVASWYAQDHPDQIDGLLLFGSYSDRDLSARTDLAVESVWGSNDGLTTPDDIDRTRGNLPATTEFTEIVGGVHAYFGDYGEQPGDGSPQIDRDQATAEISAAAVDFMNGSGGARFGR